MSKIRKLSIAVSLLEHVDMFDNIDMVGMLYLKQIPESYKFIEDLLINNYRLSIYMDGNRYIVDIRHVGIFQLM
jgi:hypothetical protein